MSTFLNNACDGLCRLRVHAILLASPVSQCARSRVKACGKNSGGAALRGAVCEKSLALVRVELNTRGFSFFLPRTTLSKPGFVAAKKSQKRRGDIQRLKGMKKLAKGSPPPKIESVSATSLASCLRVPSSSLHSRGMACCCGEASGSVL